MRRSLLSLVLLPFSILLFGAGDETPEEILRRVEAEMLKHSSISYDLRYLLKFFSRDDTLAQSVRCDLVRVQEDSILGGAAWFTIYDSIENGYDLDKILSINRTNATGMSFKAHEGEDFALKGEFGISFFLQPDKLSKLMENDENRFELAEDVIDGRKCWKVCVRFPDEEEFSDAGRCYWIDRETYLPIRVDYMVKFQGNYQFNEWTIANIRFDAVDLEALKERAAERIRDYAVTPFEHASEEEMTLLEVKSIAPDFTGLRYGDDANVRLSESSARLQLLDFWYTSCYPCLQALPYLDTLYQKYKDKGLSVWGVNSVDNNENGKKRLPKFIEHNRFDYPVIFVDRSVDSLYLVRGYPTLYILNDRREVVYADVGFGKPSFHILEGVIRKELGLDESGPE